MCLYVYLWGIIEFVWVKDNNKEKRVVRCCRILTVSTRLPSLFLVRFGESMVVGGIRKCMRQRIITLLFAGCVVCCAYRKNN